MAKRFIATQDCSTCRAAFAAFYKTFALNKKEIARRVRAGKHLYDHPGIDQSSDAQTTEGVGTQHDRRKRPSG